MSEPADVVKETGTPGNALPLMSKILAVMVVVPPNADTLLGFAPTRTPPTDAVPTAILIAPAVPVDAPPEIALMFAVPLLPPATNVTRT